MYTRVCVNGCVEVEASMNHAPAWNDTLGHPEAHLNVSFHLYTTAQKWKLTSQQSSQNDIQTLVSLRAFVQEPALSQSGQEV